MDAAEEHDANAAADKAPSHSTQGGHLEAIALPTSGPFSNQNALRLAWTFGFNKDIVNGVHSLSTETRRALFYTSAHTGVIYDYSRRQQKLLQGHCHPISCCVVSEDKHWIVTADRGDESMIVVWDSITGNPIKTIFQPHPFGVQAIDISPDALFLVTLSAVDLSTSRTASDTNQPSSQKKKHPRFHQELSVWEWTAPAAASTSSALYSSFVATEDMQHAVRFNTYDIREIVTNGKQRVIFWNWQEQRLLFYSPSLSQRDFRQVVGDFTMSIFVPDSKQALTGTEDGDLVLWDAVRGDEEDDFNASTMLKATGASTTSDSSSSNRFPDRKAVKIVRLAGGSELQQKVALTFIADMDGYLILGSSDGAVRFYDFDFRLVAWFEDMNAGAITSVSFASSSDSNRQDDSRSEASATTAQARRLGGSGKQTSTTNGHEDEEFFLVPDFIVATSSAFIVGMTAALFAEHEAEKRRGTLLMQGINDAIHGLATHPLYAQLALSSYSGVIQLWDYTSKRLIMMRKFEPEKFRPQCLVFSSDGRKLLVGFTSGAIKILHAQTLEDIAMFRLSKVAITDIRISSDSSLFVAVDANLYMGMWRAKSAADGGGDGDDTEWTYIGRCRAHSKPITGLEFLRASDASPLLVSVSEDKTMVEYCLSRSSILDGIVLTQSPVRIEQSATPTACCWHPEMKSLQEDLLLVANDEYKVKQWNTSNKTCRKTTLGPSYGGPINRLVPIPVKAAPGATPGAASRTAASGAAERYCAYSTHEKVVGLLKLPLDGNPHKTMGLIAHPGEVSNIDVSFDGSFLMTAGGSDLVVNMWEIDTNQLDFAEAAAGATPRRDDGTPIASTSYDAALAPYVSLLEGGFDGEFYHEIVDYFYLAQLRVQGENATSSREITAAIPLHEIPNVMRALGFYPTDQEIQHMCSEVKYSKFTETTEAVKTITLPELIKLYVNHRSVFGIGKAQIEHAFQVLTGSVLNASLRWETLERRLLHSGEAMSDEELRSCLNALIVADDGGRIAMDASYTALSFADKVLGFDDYEAPEDDSEAIASPDEK
uniref:Cilia- and flagella-associated protein 251 n=1 Tax=Globisporangium ultimum (strain ATCC 200006 / CBS 805.95 / DAOM BR144) TaxID=431595 RepID=K3WHW6_GLOUD